MTRSKRPLRTLAAALACLGIVASAAARGVADEGLVRLTLDGDFKQRLAWSPDGRELVFVRHRGTTLWLYVLSTADGTERRLTDRTDPEFDAAWSPDGKRLAVTIDKTSPNQQNIEVYTIAADGTDLKPLAVDQGKLSHEESPAWSPDDRWIAFSSTADGKQDLYLIPPGGGERRRLTNDPALDTHPTWSPDGKRLAFATSRWGDMELAVLDVGTEEVSRMTHSPGLDDYPAWSPDGRRIAFTSNRDGNPEVYVVAPDGTGARNVTRDEGIDNYPAWTPDGRLTFVSNRDGGFEIYAHAAIGD